MKKNLGMTKRILALILALVLTLSCAPVQAFAAETVPPTEAAETVPAEATAPETLAPEETVPETEESTPETTEETVPETTEETVPEITVTAGETMPMLLNENAESWDVDGDSILEILAIGNSFSVDALEYAYQIAKDLGIEEIVLGNLYIGGCSLETHAANVAGNLGKYTYYYNDNGTWKTTANYKISTALESRSWDYVSLQQASNYSGVESTYNEDLANLIAYVRECSNAKLVWHMTWAYQQNSTHSAFPTYNKDQMTMYNAIVSAVQNKIATNSNFDLIVPNGTAVQNSRTSLLGDTTTRDGYHMSYDYGRYLTGLLFIKTVTGLSVDNIAYAPIGVDAQEMAIAIESVNNAFSKPFAVTQSAYAEEEPEIPDEGYILLRPELYKGAYWYPIDVKNYNVPVTDASNSRSFFATIRFTREDIPVGSVIMIDSGWQYRPDGWVTDTVQSGRADTTTEAYTVVTEEWWGKYTIRGFNISKVGTPSLMNLNAEDIHKVFCIYVPEESHVHKYTDGICTFCGAKHPNLANYQGKVISILGDSISTFAGYIPKADGFNLEHYARYPQDNLFTEVEHTWWMQVLTALNAKLGINESWRSTEVGNIYDVEVNSGYEGTKACMASTTRIQNLGSNGTPDVILFYGGTNDITQRRTIGTFDPAAAPTEVDLTSEKWDTVAEAYVAAIMRMQHYYPDAEILAMLPTFTYKNTDAVIEEYNSVFAAICEHYGVAYIDLRDCGITTADLPDGTHPNEAGMDYITASVLDALQTHCSLEAGEHTVHSVTHNLTGAESSLSYYKGISHGKSFVTTLTGEDLKVSVTMGGVDITSDCYTNGIVSIKTVTDDVVITAEGIGKPVYADYLQTLPENVCAGMNLWDELQPINLYYTASGWGINANGLAHSVTLPISSGDQIWATSFQAGGSNGSTSNGIRLTWFDEDGVLKALSPAETYSEFSANGYLTAPNGAVAVNVVMWNNSDSNALYILNRPHSYSGGKCTSCGEANPNVSDSPENPVTSGWPKLDTDLTHIVGYGQSFSVGADAPIYPDSPVDGVYVYGSITDSSKGTALAPVPATGTQHPVISAGNSLAQMLSAAGIDTDIIIGSYGSGGRTIAQLMSEERQAQIKAEKGYTYDCLSSGRYQVFQNSVEAIAEYADSNGKTVSCPAIVYLQGETDQNTDQQLGYPDNPARAGYGAGGDKETYKEYMTRLKEDMQQEVMEAYSQTEKPLFIIYQVSGTYTRTQYSSINMAQIEFAQENEDVILVQTPYFTPHYTNSHHLTVNGYRWLGEYIAKYLHIALTEGDKPWPMMPAEIAIETDTSVRITVAGAQSGLTIDTWTVENATNSMNRYGFYLVVNGTRVVPQNVTVSGNQILLTLPDSTPLSQAAESVYVYYAGKDAKGTGNIRDNCHDTGFYAYLDDSNDTGTGNNQGVSHSALDANGESLAGKKYPLYNWLVSFCYELKIPETEQKQPAFYHWEMQDTGMVSVVTDEAKQNDLTLLQGSVESGILKNVQYSMARTVTLYHNKPWVIEWKAAGNGSSYGGGMLLASSEGSGSKADLYLPADSRGFVAWNISSEGRNYGFQLGKNGIDTRTEHIYRIENRIAVDGTNTVCLIVDGVEIGDMHTPYSTSNGALIDDTKNWANGTDLYLRYMGKQTNFLLNNLKLSYLKIWENSCQHSYTSVVTAPTCTEQGYTTHTCTVCGDSYVSDYTEKLNLTIIPITSAEVEQGGYYYGQDSALATRLRGADQIFVEAGTTVKYSANGLRVFFAIVSGPDAESYLEGGQWHTDSGEFQVTTDGYLSIIISKPNPKDEITVSDYTADIEIHLISDCAHNFEVVVIKPTNTTVGCTTHKCTICGHSYITDYAEVKPYRILLIGNSFSHDAMRQFPAIAEAMLGENARVEVHLSINAAKTIAWHATQASENAASYKHRYYTTDRGKWIYADDPLVTLQELLTSEEWDVITLQSYYPEINTGTAKGLEGESDTFLSTDASVPFMLDYIDRYAPQAEIYYYMAWQATTDTSILDAGRVGFNQILAMMPRIMAYSGTNSGRRFNGVIPVGTAVQNARNTYLGRLSYMADGDKETVIGLQRDGVHMAYTIGGYIAALTFAEYLIPEAQRVEGYVLPDVQKSAILGALPEEYTMLTRWAVDAALKAPDTITVLPGYETDPCEAAVAAIEKSSHSYSSVTDEASLKTAILAEVRTHLTKQGFQEPVVTVKDCQFADGKLQNFHASVTIRFGYTTREVTLAQHAYTAAVITPTCTEQGYTTHTCTVCGDSYVDSYVVAKGHTEVTDKAIAATCTAAGKTEGKHCSVCSAVIVAQKEVPAKGHTEVTDKAVSATCTTAGKTEGKHCSTCGTVLVAQKEIPAPGHSYGAWTVVTNPTCTEKGQERRECASCDAYEARGVAAKGHTEVTDKAVPATCTTAGKTEGKHCSACGTILIAQKNIAALGHTWDAGKVTKEPTEQTEGVKTFTCTACGETKTETIPVLSHTHKYTAKVTAPTCTEQGYTTYTCTCGDSYTDNFVVAKGHSYGAWTVTTNPTCTEKGSERGDCANCDAYETRDVAAKGHTEVIDKAVSATCTTAGKTEGKHCSVCSTVLVKQNEIPAKGHAWDVGVVTKEPTESAEGVKTYTCTVCGETKTQSIPVLSHTHKYTAKVTTPTCTEQGYTTYTCTCGDSYVDNFVVAKGHSYGAWTVTTSPTCTEKGSERRDCANCDAYETRDVAAKGHTEVIDKAVSATCTTAGKTEGKHCSVCSTVLVAQKDIAALGHTWDVGVVTKEPTESESGESVFTCQTCGETKTVTLPPLAHVHRYASQVTPPTCTSQGYTTYTCACGDSYVDDYVDATGHEAEKWASDAKGHWSICSCGEILDIGLHDGDPCSVCGYEAPDQAHGYDLGDVNHDGKINAKDATLILQKSVGVLKETAVFCEECAEVSGDGKLNAKDSTLILQFSVGLRDSFPGKK